MSFDLVSYGAGLTSMSLGRFALATAAGAAPFSFAAASLGTAASFDGPAPWLLGGAVVLALLLLPRWLERRGWIDPQRWHGG